MKTAPITPAQIDFGADGVLRAPAFGDIYHPRIGALAQARHVFLHGNGLPARWGGRARFVVLELGFGLGNNFLTTWAAWRDDPARCEQLCFVSIERHPPLSSDLERAHAGSALPQLAAALVQAWPPLTPNLHALDFDGGRVKLLLGLGDVAALLPGLRVQADTFFLDGFAPARNPAMWQPRVLKALASKAAAGATLATWSVARELRDGLAAAGFEVQRAPGIGGKREITVAHWAPRFVPQRLPDMAVATREAVVVGAGIAGAAVAQALAREGLAVTVFERHATAAAESSGNPAGLFHGTVHGDDGIHARLFRAAALQAARDHGTAFASGRVPGHARGLLRLDGSAVEARAALLRAQGLPPDYVQALDAFAASALAGVALPRGAWHYPQGGWLDPAAWVHEALSAPGVQLRRGVAVAGLRRHAEGWELLDAVGQVLARSRLIVLANAAQAAALLAPLGHAGWPLSHTRGQVSGWTGSPTPLALPVAGDGYALPMPDGLLCGATREAGEPGDDAAPRLADHRLNFERLRRLTGLQAPADAAQWQGRVGWRMHSGDSLPICGALPRLDMAAGQRGDQARLLPRESGLFVCAALGARGLTLAPLLARVLAAQATSAPWPLEQDLADAIDPARWRVRAARAAGTRRGDQPAG